MIRYNEDAKKSTLKTIFRLIRDHGEMTRSELAELTSLKQSTLTRAVDQLLQSGWIKEKGQAGSTGGRRPTLYEIEKNAGFMIGIDISRTYCSLLLVNLANEVLDESHFSMRSDRSPKQMIRLMIEAIHQFLIKHQILKEQLIGIGIGTVGPLNRENGYLLAPVHFPMEGWGDFSLIRAFEEEFDVPVLLENGANTAAWAEFRSLGLNKYHRNISYTHIGIGIRCGIISEGHIVQGNNQEDAFGHTVVDIDGKPCSCGNFGCLETYCSIPAVVSSIKSEIKKGRESMLTSIVSNIEHLCWDDVMQALHEKDPLCEDVVREAALYCGTGIANLINTLHPEVVILGGPMIQHSDLFYQQIKASAEKKIYRAPGYTVEFKVASLEKRSIALGAAIFVLDQYLFR